MGRQRQINLKTETYLFLPMYFQKQDLDASMKRNQRNFKIRILKRQKLRKSRKKIKILINNLSRIIRKQIYKSMSLIHSEMWATVKITRNYF